MEPLKTVELLKEVELLENNDTNPFTNTQGLLLTFNPNVEFHHKLQKIYQGVQTKKLWNS
jgi:hypothetical protein